MAACVATLAGQWCRPSVGLSFSLHPHPSVVRRSELGCGGRKRGKGRTLWRERNTVCMQDDNESRGAGFGKFTSSESLSSDTAAQLVVPRRFVVGVSVALLAAFGGNLGGVTSSVLSANGAVSRKIRADVLYPVMGYKRCFEPSKRFEFIYPATWVGDQRLLYRAIERAERERSLDLPSPQQRFRSSIVEPAVAFGPPGSNGELNVSIVVAPALPGFKLENLGSQRKQDRSYYRTL